VAKPDIITVVDVTVDAETIIKTIPVIAVNQLVLGGAF
jgi:hypothetical protein